MTVAATGTGPGWRRAALLVSTDDGASWAAAGGTAAPAVIGTLASVPAAAGSMLFDLAGSIEVDLARADLALEDADDGRLDAGANLAIAGEELIQFGRAAPLGGTRWRLSRLLRGRRGTEAAAGTQTVGDRFVLLDDDSVRQLDLPLAAIGSAVRIMATGIGDISGPVERIVTIDGRSVLPPSPVHLVATDGPDGGAALSWIRRSRGGWRWLDGADAPLVEESEDYRVVVTSADGSARDVETAAPVIAISAAERALGPVNVAGEPARYLRRVARSDAADRSRSMTMADTSARLNLPLLAPGQAQKELYHNEALTLIDLAVQASVVTVGPRHAARIAGPWANAGSWGTRRPMRGSARPARWRDGPAAAGASWRRSRAARCGTSRRARWCGASPVPGWPAPSPARGWSSAASRWSARNGPLSPRPPAARSSTRRRVPDLPRSSRRCARTG